MICPKCNSEDTRIDNTRKCYPGSVNTTPNKFLGIADQLVRRLHVCDGCDHRFASVDLLDDDLMRHVKSDDVARERDLLIQFAMHAPPAPDKWFNTVDTMGYVKGDHITIERTLEWPWYWAREMVKLSKKV